MCQSKSRSNVVLCFLLPMKLICPALIKCVEHPPVLYFFICDSSVTRVANILSDSSLIRTRPSQKCLTLGGLPQPDICCLMTERWSQSWRPVRIITSSSSKIFRDLSILLTLIPGNSSQLVKILLYQRLSLGGKDAACEISSHLDLSQVITGHTHTAHCALLD